MISVEGDTLKLSGRLDLTTLMAYRSELENHLPFERDIQVDLSGLEIEGSAVLALLILVLRVARREGGRVTFTGVSENLAAMASLAGLTELLAFTEPAGA